MSRFLRFCAFLSVLFFSANAMAAGYLCPTYRKYTSCNAGYYLNGTGVGNACVKCSPGTYQPSNGSNATSCTKCAVGSYNTGSGNTACLPCTNGYTNTTTGSSSCGTKCANNNGNVSSWIGEWYAASNTALDICGVDVCKSGYERQTLSGGLYYCNANQYTVKYNGNGSTSGSMSNGTFYYNTEQTLVDNGFSRTGYTFQGWSRSSSATTAEYVNAASVKFTTNSSGTIYADGTTINLYAVWTPNKPTITLDSNGATSGGTTAIYSTYNTNVYLDSARSKAMTTSANAITKPTRSYTVTYNANGGSVSPTSATSTYTFGGYYSSESSNNGTGTQYITANGYITSNGLTAGKGYASNATWYAKWTSASVPLPTPTRTGYTFNGWSTSSTATSGVTGSYTPTSNVTLYATWTPNKPTITLDGNGATSGGTTAIYSTYNTNVYLDNARSKAMTTSANAITKPTRSYTVTYNANGGSVSPTSATAAYTFGGYYSSESSNNGTGTQYLTSNGYITSNGLTAGKGYASNTTWYAKWTSACVPLPTPTRTGYTFNGWSTSSTATSGVTGSYTPTSNVTLYATWSANNYNIKYFCGDEEDAIANGGNATAKYNSSFTYAAASACAGRKSGYTQTGWTSTTTGAKGLGASETWSYATDVDMQAVWEPNTYTVSFNGNSQASGSPSVASVTCEYDKACTAATMGNLAKTKRVFLGWSMSSSATSATYAPGASIKNISTGSPVTLYAVWIEPTCTAGTGVASTSLNSVSGNAPVCNRSSKDGYYCAATQTGSAGATSLTVTCTAAGNGYYAKAGATSQTACPTGSYSAKSSASSTCTACPGGRTTSGSATAYNATANTACSVTCSNNTNAATWNTPSWSTSGVSNLCSIATCASKYTRTGTTSAAKSYACTACTCTKGSNVSACSVTGTNASNQCTYSYTCTTGYHTSGTFNGTAGTAANTSPNCTINTFTVVFNSNKPNTATSTMSGSMSNQSFTYGTAQNLTANAFSLPGYTFAGWATSATGSVVYADKESVSNLTTTHGATVNLYAKWTANTITLNWNENNGAAVSNGSCTYDSTFSVPAATTRTGYSFGGWKLSSGTVKAASASGVACTHANTGVYSGTSTAITAQWSGVPYTVTFKSGNTTLGTQSFEYGTAQALTKVANLSNIPVASANGWSTFVGWSTGADYTAEHTDGKSVSNLTSTSGGNVILYAIWSRPVTFKYYNSATATSVTTSTRTQYYYNTSTTAAGVNGVSTYALATQSSYSWAPVGWVLNSNTSTTTASTATTTTGTVTPAANAAAVYTALYKRTATLAYNGNSSTSGSTSSTTGTQYYNVGNGSANTLNLTLATNGFSKTGHTFSKWAAGSTSGTQYAAGASYAFPNKAWNTTGSYTMYAIWTVNKYNVTINKNGGSGTLTVNGVTQTGATNVTFQCTYGTTFTLPAWASGSSSANNMTKSNSIFTGWNTTSPVTCNGAKTVTANWSTATCNAGTGVESVNSVTVSDNKVVCGITCADGYAANEGEQRKHNVAYAPNTARYSAAGVATLTATCYPACIQWRFGYAEAEKGGGTGGTTYVYKYPDSTTYYSNDTCTTKITKITLPTKTNATYMGAYEHPECVDGECVESHDGYDWLDDTYRCVAADGTLSTSAACASMNNTHGFYNVFSCNSLWQGSGTVIAEACTRNTYKLAYNMNCPSGATCSSAPAGTNCTYGSTCSYSSISSTSLYAGGYKLIGWATSTTGTAATSGSNLTTTQGGTVTMYAIWSQCAAGTYHAAATGAAANTCTNVSAGCYGAAKATSACPSECPKGKYSTGGAASCTNVKAGCYADTTKSTTECPKSCSALGGKLYVNSNAGSDSENDCYFTTTAGKYLVASTDTAQTQCPVGQYCTAETLNYPNVSELNSGGGWNDCPAVSGRQMTTFPDNYKVYDTNTTSIYSSTVSVGSVSLQKWSKGQTSASQCRAIYSLSNDAGNFVDESVWYNPSTDKYDIASGNQYYTSLKGGYYAMTRYSATYCDDRKETDTQKTLYSKAVVCPANSYCPAVSSFPKCYGNEYTETYNNNLCTSLGSFYTTSAKKSSAASQCYGTTTAGKYIATANSSTQTTCEGGYACPSANVYYGSTGSRSKCTGATYSGDGASSCTSCPTATLASATGDYGYWIGDDIHNTVTGCYAAHKTTNASGTIIGNCFADENGVYGRRCNNFNGSTCNAGYYYRGTNGFSSIDEMFSGVCVDVGSGNYFAGGAVTWNTAQVPSSCSALGGIGVSSTNATYSSVSPRDTSKTCRFTAGAVTKTGCSSVVSNAVVYDGSNWGSNYYTAKAAKGYRVSSTDGANPSCTPCAAGTYQGSDNSTATTCGTCANWTYSGSGAASCTSCPTVESGYTKLDSTGTGWTTYTKCVEIASASPSNCSAGKLQKIPTASGATTWASPTVNSSNPLSAKAGYYVNGTQCAACGDSNYYCTGGTAARKTVTTGYYSTGGTSTTRTGQSQCTGSTYCVSGEQKNCPTAETNWTLGTGTGWSAVTSCFETRAATNVSSNCSAGQLKKNATSSATWPTSASISVAFQADPGSIVSGQTCVQCTGATYSAGGTATQCSACDTNYQANTSAGKSVATQCQTKCAAGTAVVTENNACADIKNSTYKGKFTTEHLVNYGSKSSISTCPTSYQDGNGTTAQANCINSCAAGTQVAAANADCSTPSNTTYGASWYTSAHNVTYGKTSKSMSLVGSCPSTYTTPDTTTASNHDAKSDCTTTCAAGKVVASADAACSVPSGSWYSAQHTVSAGSTSGTNKKSCNSGYATANTTTQTDHDAAADCKISCSAGYYIPTAGEGCKVCTAGKYCSAISNIAQTSTSAVTGNVNAGYWNNGCGTNATGSVCSTSYSGGLIAAGYYGTAGATASTGAGMVSGGYYSTGGGTSATPSSNGNGCVGTGNTCGKLSAAYYSNGGSTTNGATCVSGKVCGTCDSNYRANTNTGKTAVTQCQTQCAAGTAVVTENKACADIKNSTYKGKYTPQHNVAYGSVSTIQSCPTYYQDSSVGVAGEANCINSCAAGTQVATANADCSTPNTANWYTNAHDVTYGKTSAGLSKVVSCDSDYGNSGTTAANHAGVTSCKVTCPAGTWVASANAACTDVTSGYYRTTSETVSQTKTGTRSACTDLGVIYNASDGGRDAATDCFATTTAKKWVAANKATAESTCTAGYYCGGGTKVYYNSTGGRKVCEAGSFCVAGVSEPTACAVGSYTSTTGQSACTACTNGKTTSEAGKTSCDATCANASGANAWSTASWTNNTVANLCTISKCNANTYYTATTATGYKNTCTACGANSSTSAGNTSTTCTCTTGYTSTGKVGGAATSTSGCSLISDIACAIGQYVPAKATSCSACTAGYYCPSTAKTYSYSSSIQGRTACSPGTYQPDTGKTSCVKASLGYHVSDSAQTAQTACSGATYAATEGQAECTTCPTAKNPSTDKVAYYGYWISGNGPHTERSGCQAYFEQETLTNGTMKAYCFVDADEDKDTYGIDGTAKSCYVLKNGLKCNGGYYNEMFNSNSTATQQSAGKTLDAARAKACVPVTAGYWSADESLNRTACATGLTTIGYGTAANEAEDCGRKLHAGNNVVYLRSGQRSTPTLKIRMKLDEDDEDYTVLYGALSTSLSGALKVKKGTTEYSVVNDWQ